VVHFFWLSVPLSFGCKAGGNSQAWSDESVNCPASAGDIESGPQAAAPKLGRCGIVSSQVGCTLLSAGGTILRSAHRFLENVDGYCISNGVEDSSEKVIGMLFSPTPPGPSSRAPRAPAKRNSSMPGRHHLSPPPRPFVELN